VVVIGPQDADLWYMTINLVHILVYYVMKTKPHAQPNLCLSFSNHGSMQTSFWATSRETLNKGASPDNFFCLHG
jgi:hypothetical protein